MLKFGGGHIYFSADLRLRQKKSANPDIRRRLGRLRQTHTTDRSKYTAVKAVAKTMTRFSIFVKRVYKQNWLQFLFAVKATTLKQQISEFYPPIISTEASHHIYTSQWPVINVQEAQLSPGDYAMRRVS